MKEKGHRVHEMVVPSVVKAVVGNRLARANSASHGPRVRSKERTVRKGVIQRKIQRFQSCHRLAQ